MINIVAIKFACYTVLQFRNAQGQTWPKTTNGIHKGLVRIAYTISSKYCKLSINILVCLIFIADFSIFVSIE